MVLFLLSAIVSQSVCVFDDTATVGVFVHDMVRLLCVFNLFFQSTAGHTAACYLWPALLCGLRVYLLLVFRLRQLNRWLERPAVFCSLVECAPVMLFSLQFVFCEHFCWKESKISLLYDVRKEELAPAEVWGVWCLVRAFFLHVLRRLCLSWQFAECLIRCIWPVCGKVMIEFSRVKGRSVRARRGTSWGQLSYFVISLVDILKSCVSNML